MDLGLIKEDIVPILKELLLMRRYLKILNVLKHLKLLKDNYSINIEKKELKLQKCNKK